MSRSQVAKCLLSLLLFIAAVAVPGASVDVEAASADANYVDDSPSTATTSLANSRTSAARVHDVQHSEGHPGFRCVRENAR